MWIYTYHYTDRKMADLHRYFNDGMILHRSFAQDPLSFAKMFFGIDTHSAELQNYYDKMLSWGAEYSNIASRLNALLCFISFESIAIHVIVFCFVSLYCLHLLSLAISANKWQWCAIMLSPSVLLWNSVVLKDGIILCALSIFFYGLSIKTTSIKKAYWLVALGCFILIFSKAWILALFPPVLFSVFYGKKFSLKTLFISTGSYFIILIFLDLIFNIGLPQILLEKQLAFSKLALEYRAASAFHTPVFQANYWSIAKAIPLAWWNAISRPYLWEAKNLLQALAGIESLVIVVLSFAALVFQKSSRSFSPIYAYALLLSVVYLILCGLSTPIAGALVRYRMVVLPLYLASISILLKPKKSAQC